VIANHFLPSIIHFVATSQGDAPIFLKKEEMGEIILLVDKLYSTLHQPADLHLLS
jgi:hypothetical protein